MNNVLLKAKAIDSVEFARLTQNTEMFYVFVRTFVTNLNKK